MSDNKQIHIQCLKESYIDAIDTKVDKIAETLVEIKVSTALNTQTLVKNTEDMRLHIERTNILQNKQDSFSRVQNMMLGSLIFISCIIPVVLFILNFMLKNP